MDYKSQYIKEISSLVDFIKENNYLETINQLERVIAIEYSSDDFYAVKVVRESFALDLTEQVSLYYCYYLLVTGKDLIKRNSLWDILSPAGFLLLDRPSPIFYSRDSYLNSIVASFLLEKVPVLPRGYQVVLDEGEIIHHSQELLDEIVSFVQKLSDTKEDILPATVLLCGEKGVGKRFLLSKIATQVGCTLLIIDAKEITQIDLITIKIITTLYSSLICITNGEDGLLHNEIIKEFPLVFITANNKYLGNNLVAGSILRREMPEFIKSQRLLAVRDMLGTKSYNWTDNYQPSIGEIKELSARLKAESLINSDKTAENICLEILRQKNRLPLLGIAEPLTSNRTLQDLILPEQQKSQLKNICNFARAKEQVFKDWGFRDKVPYDGGISALFYGASGTGKTMAATVIAAELGLELFRVDLSQLTSKYIGDTQKNIGRVFDKAKDCNCILFFDEADALFSRRSDGGDSQDRYSNGEIAYLLQKTEQYDGIILLATNLLQNFDEAFRRRIGFMINFPLPDANLRKRLWENILPKSAPKEVIDYEVLAKHLELSGAGIKNAALNGAYLAAVNGEKISIRHLIDGARIEYQKEGKTFPLILEYYI